VQYTIRSRGRRLLTCGLITSASILIVLVCVIGGAGAWFFNQARQSNVGELSFATELAIPPLLEPRVDDQGRKVFDLVFTAGMTELVPGEPSETWGLNGPYLSPTLRASGGDEVVVNVTNGVDEPTTLHWHGMHLPAAMDGGPHQMIAPGETWSPTWTIDQPAATLWFHPHLHGQTAEHVYRGAAGLFLLDDEESTSLDIPAEYGVDDIPLVIQDRQTNREDWLSVNTSFMRDLGILGDEILINGTHAPRFEATTTLVRFRVLNASNARIYNLGFTDGREYWLIGTDTGLLESPLSMTRLQISPGERAEIVVAVAPNDDVMLRSFAPDLGLDFFSARLAGGHDTFDLLRIHTADRLAESPPLPAKLVSIDRPSEAEAATTRRFELNGSTRVNGKPMDMSRIDEVVTVDTTEVWEITNASGTLHNFHVHLIHFLILDIDGERPPAHLQGWKDTVFIPRGSTVRIIARFEEHADPSVPYMYHCHFLRHEDSGMMGQFVVVAPGTEPPERIPVPSNGHSH
jgi:blue copper oxidase